MNVLLEYINYFSNGFSPTSCLYPRVSNYYNYSIFHSYWEYVTISNSNTVTNKFRIVIQLQKQCHGFHDQCYTSLTTFCEDCICAYNSLDSSCVFGFTSSFCEALSVSNISLRGFRTGTWVFEENIQCYCIC